MNLLKTIIERLNQRVEVANIFDKQFNLCELNANGNDKAWVHYIGNGQAEVVTNFDAKNGTLFWAKRGKVSVAKTDAYKMSGCKQLYVTTFPLTAYAIVRKSHLPCDAEDAQDWLASRVYKLTSGTDPLFKQSIGVINYEVVPSGYANEIKTLTANYEWACVSVDMDVQVITTSEDGCYDTCATGDIPLPDLQPCVPCLTEVAVDGVTITGNGTTADPLVAIGGGGGTPLITKEEGTNVSTNTTTLNFTGAGVTASLTSPGVVEVNVPGGGGGGVTSVSGTAPIASSGGATPAISISQASTSTDGYLSQTDWDTFNNKFNVPTGLVTDYLDGLGTPTPFPAIPNAQVNSDWNATTGVEEILNKPTIPAAQVNSDWNATSGIAEILNKPTLATGSVTSVDLTMPSAFTVTGNPITTSGTLGVTANGVATQYIRGDGQLANFPTSTGGGASVSYYLNGSVSQGTFGGIAMREINKVPVIGAGTDFTINADGYIQSFITDANDPNQLAIPAGNWNFESYFSASSNGGNPRFYIELYKWDGATLTLIASNSTNPENITGGTTIDLYLTALAVPQTTLAVTDRLAVRFYVIHSGRTITMHTEDNHLSQIITTFSTGLTSLNGLTAQTQLLAVGTSGTDFAISSTTATHTFNLPTASAANRGALSSADWTAFDAKQAALVSGTNIKTINSTSLLGSGNITIASLGVYKSTTDGAASSGTTNTYSQGVLIPANSVAAGNMLEFKLRGRKTGANAVYTIRLYANTTNNLSGSPVLLATYTATLIQALALQTIRTAAVKNVTTNTEMALATTSLATDFANTSFASIAVDWTTDKYIVGAVQNSNATDSSLISLISMTII